MRRVNKNRKKLVIAGIFLTVLLLLAVLFSVRIKSVTVSGNERYTDEQIESMIFDTAIISIVSVHIRRFLLWKTIK